MVWRFVADDALGDDIRLIIGVLHRFEPDLGALGKVVRMRCAVADRIDVGQARLAERVDAHPVGAIRARRNQGLDRGDDTDADDDEIGGDHLAVRQPHAGDMRLALDRIDAHAEAQVDAVIAIDCVNATKDYVQGRMIVTAGLRATAEQLADTETPLKALLPA